MIGVSVGKETIRSSKANIPFGNKAVEEMEEETLGHTAMLTIAIRKLRAMFVRAP